ncbi:ADP-ribosylation factor-like protein 15 isoform X2 [Choloepus didactylus]|uniref:ADP-ribosylation factor-like protein 15 isoform X2 n=1 Tax=Choloepus didactylus TaxID=27675 RepID=UPI00189F85D6|nr:ADP-ribosylation factor-like protein 15 isoform X2 [Choloepus didactylus]
MSDLRITEVFLYMDYLCFRALCCKGPPPARPEYDLVCIGLTGSGKTSLLSKLCSESPENVVSTTGFSIKAVPFQNAILNVKELGGADNIRKYWSRYYQGSQGVIFVLDSASSEDDLETARNELHSALQHPQLCTLPFLILANHQDKPAARSVQELFKEHIMRITMHHLCSSVVFLSLLNAHYWQKAVGSLRQSSGLKIDVLPCKFYVIKYILKYFNMDPPFIFLI